MDSEFVPAFHKEVNKKYSNNENNRAFFRENMGRNFNFYVQIRNLHKKIKE